MDEAIRCDRIAFINHGKLLTIDTPKKIIQNFEEPLWAIQGDNLFDLMQTLRLWDLTKSCFSFGDCLHFTATSKAIGNQEIKAYLGTRAVEIQAISPTIEDCFMAYLQN
jgi:ABC-type multidrug transport system ATPase subunit